MVFSLKRLPRLLLLLATIAGGLQPSLAAPPAKVVPAKAAAAESTVPWLYQGSDIPPDPAWTFGVLPNGVRYAVRRNGVPPHQVSIRVGIEAGSLMEGDSELGFAHFMEHLSFRGSKYIADGEAIRTWQRLGATFGSDTNATTSHTQTIYKLDLPAATREGLDESMKVLSGMMTAPTISPSGVETERRTVLAEAREQPGPAVRAGQAASTLFYAGQLAADRSPIGKTATLQAATAASLRAFHDRWYRPERAVIVIAGDADPETFKQLIEKYFSGWKGIGPAPAEPDFGKPDPGAPRSTILVEPGLPLSVTMGVFRPWFQKNDTVVYNQGKLVDLVAMRLINRRLEERARAGGSFLQASINQEDISRSVDATYVQVVPLGDDWQAALRDVRAVIADALASPSPQADIDREANEFISALQQAVETERSEAGAKQADDILGAVDIRETVASAQVALDVFGGIKDRITPALILDSTKRLFQGTPTRAMLLSPTPVTDGDTKLVKALTDPVTALATSNGSGSVSFADLPALGKPGRVVKREALQNLGIEQIEFGNGVRMLVYPNEGEANKIYVNVRFGRGLQALPRDRQTVAWAGPPALLAGGVGKLDQNAIDRLTSGRKIGVNFDIGDNAFVLNGQTRPADLIDQLKLMAAFLTAPRWDDAPVLRARASFLTGYDTLESGPQSVLSRDLTALLHGGDARWQTPSRPEIEGLTPKAFQKFWAPLLKTGPIEVRVFGDVSPETAIAAVGGTFGAIKKRSGGRILSGSERSASAPPTRETLIRTHKGDPDQAAAVLAWPTGGGLDSIYESRKLEMIAQIFNDRLFDQLRGTEGASYSPQANSQWPSGLDSGGNFIVISQLQPDKTELFYKVARSIAADLAAKPVSADELERTVNPIQELISRIATGNTFWLNQLAGATQDKRRVTALRTLLSDYQRITPAELQAAAARWFVPAKEFRFAVLPEKAAAKPK